MNIIAYIGFFAIAFKMVTDSTIDWWYIGIPFYIVFAEPIVKWLYNRVLLFEIKRVNRLMFDTTETNETLTSNQ